LLGLVRLEQEDGRRAEYWLLRLVAVRLRDDARLLGNACRLGMVEIVRVLERVGEDGSLR